MRTDLTHSASPIAPRRRGTAVAIAALSAGALTVGALTAGASAARAQLPGLPVFQGAFPAPGLAVGLDVGRGSGQTMVAGAIGYGSRSGRFGLSAGVGAYGDDEPGYRKGRLAYGARVALTPLRFADERIAVTPFAGFGSRRATLANAATAGPPAVVGDTGRAIQTDEVPLGVSAGWRVRLGASRAAALSIVPAYVLYRRAGGDGSLDATRWAMRVATVAEVAVASRIGVTLGAEFGQAASATEPGPRGARLGLGISVGLARR